MRLSFYLIVGTVVTALCSFTYKKASVLGKETFFPTPHTYNFADYAKMSLAEVDTYADMYVPPHQVFNYYQTREMKSRLDAEINDLANKNVLGLYWAMVRFYAGASSFVGGNSAKALIYAGYIYSLNKYLGCLAYEYTYNRINQPETARHWYEQSLTTPLQNGMEWEIIKYNNIVNNDIQVKGNFNNWKLQNLYEEKGNVYLRKIMIPKCETCNYELIIDYKNSKAPTSIEGSEKFY